MKKTELVSLLKDVSDDPKFSVCYGRGTFRPEGHFFRVEPGKRTLVLKVLCIQHHYPACMSCPNADGNLRLTRNP